MSILRPPTEHDLPLLYAYHRDPEAARLATVTPREWPAFYEHWTARILGQPDVCARVIEHDARMVGSVVSWPREGRRMVGYWVARAYWGRGVASAALAEFVGEHDTSRPLYADVAVTNLGSRRVLEKAGFRLIGAAHRGDDGVEEIQLELGALQG